MVENSSTGNTNSQFAEIMQNHSDEELVKILKKRESYQKEAANEAIKEALNRGIIHSEQDLFSEKFSSQKRGFSFFPPVDNDYARTRLIKSISRILLFSGFIPVIWGAFMIQDAKVIPGILALVFGICWLVLSFFLLRQIRNWLISALVAMCLLAFAFVIWQLISLKSIVIMDYFILVFISGFIFYGLNYLKKLNS